MGEVRAPAVAGTFYPREPRSLRAAVRAYLAEADPRTLALDPKAIIAPHAGYVYSGPVAGSAFAPLELRRREVTRVVLMGPAHRALFSGLAVPEASAFATPLGLVRIDAVALRPLLALPGVRASDRAHAGEHSLEVELPFVQEVFGDVAIVPILVGDATDEAAAGALERVWGGPETRIVVSSDLSHYLPYAEAERLDRATARAIERLSPAGIGDAQACGCTGVRGLLRVAKRRNLQATTLDLRSSGDTAGARDEVVGYGAFAIA